MSHHMSHMSHHMSHHYDHVGAVTLSQIADMKRREQEHAARTKSAPTIVRNAPAAPTQKVIISGPPQPLASLFVKKLTELARRGIIDEEEKDLQEILPYSEAQLQALVASIDSKKVEGAAVRAALEQSIVELAAASSVPSSSSTPASTGAPSAFPIVPVAIAAAGLVAVLLMRKK